MKVHFINQPMFTVPMSRSRPCVHHYWTTVPSPFPMTNYALKGLVSQTQVSAKVSETWFGRVIAPLLSLADGCTCCTYEETVCMSTLGIEFLFQFK